MLHVEDGLIVKEIVQSPILSHLSKCLGNLLLSTFHLSIEKLRLVISVELVSKELIHLAAILHVYARGLIFMKYFFS